MPFPTPRIRRFLPLMVLEFLQRQVHSFRPPLSVLEVLFALASLPHGTQQFQKNAYHNDKCVISEPASSGSIPASMTPVTFTGTENQKESSCYQ